MPTAQTASQQAESVQALASTTGDFIEEHAHQFAVLAQEEEMLSGALHTAATMPAARPIAARAIAGLTDYLYTGGHWRLGQDLFGLQLALLREIGDRAGEGATLNNLGMLADSLGQKEDARRYYEQALSIFRAIGAVESVRIVEENLQDLLVAQEDGDATPGVLPPSSKKPTGWRWPWQRK